MRLLENRAKLIEFKHECTFSTLCIRIERMVSAYDSIKKINADITELVSDCPEIMVDIAPILQKIISCQQSGNTSQLADVLETDLGSLIEQYIYNLDEQRPIENLDYYEKNKKAFIEAGQAEVINALESRIIGTGTSEAIAIRAHSGDISFGVVDKVTQKTNYLMGLINPYLDALQYVFYNMKDECIEYSMLGAGMIYEAMAMIRACVGVPVIVIEPDSELLRAVLTFVDLSGMILSGRLLFETEHSSEAIAKAIRNDSLLSRADTVNFLDEGKRSVVNRYRSIGPLSKENLQVLKFNFYKNAENKDPYLTEISERIKGKEIYLVAGGPSLSPCLSILQNKSEDSVILCVGTSARKLMGNGIIPDYVVLIDGLMSTKTQMECDFDYSKTSFLYLSTACYESVRVFEGKRYIAYQEGFDLAENRAKESGLPLFKSGGSVSTFALDAAVSLGAKKITCLGLDLAYTYDQLHASGIHEGNEIEANDCNFSVKSTSGEMISTSVGLDTYRQWIESYLNDKKALPELVNISDGAYIRGMKNVTVHEYTSL